MQIITTYNSPNSPGFDMPLAESVLNPYAAHSLFEEFRLLTEWDARTSINSGATPALVADSIGGEVAITPNGTGGGHLELKTEAYSPITHPVYFAARAKITTAGVYFIGLTQKVATNTLVVTTNAITAGTGAGFLIQTDNNADLISTDSDGTDVRTQDVKALTAGTYYNFGIVLYDTVADFYIDGKKVGSTAIASGMGAGAAKNVVPSFEAVTSAKVLTIDWCAVSQTR